MALVERRDMFLACESWQAIRYQPEVEMERRHVAIARRQVLRLGGSILRPRKGPYRRAELAAVNSAHYEGGHWLGSFAVYLTTERGIQRKAR